MSSFGLTQKELKSPTVLFREESVRSSRSHPTQQSARNLTRYVLSRRARDLATDLPQALAFV